MNVTPRHYARLLLTYLRPQRRRATLLAVLLLLGALLPLVGPQIVRGFIDRAVAGASPRALATIAALYIVVALVTQAVAVGTAYLAEQVGWTSTNLLRADLLLHCLRLDMPFHNRRTPGELIERIDGDVTALANFFSRFLISVLGSGLLLLGVLVLLYREDVRVGVALTVFSVVALVVLNACRNFAVPHMAAERQANAEFFGLIEERLAGLDDIRANGAGGHVLRRFYDSARAVYRTGRWASATSSGLVIVTMGLFAGGTVLVLGMGVYLYQAGAITLGTVYLFFQYTQMLRQPLQQITEQIKEFQKAAAGVGRVYELLHITGGLAEGCEGLPASGPVAVEVAGVSFGYGTAESVLEDVSFCLPPGSVLGLLGRTGSGKTTVARLLCRLYDPDAGSIRLAGTDLRTLRLADLRRRVGVVTQDVQLFQASVRDNLTLFDPGIPDGAILEVLETLGLGEWLRRLPAGLATSIGFGGGGLSAGEGQLLAFARVFLRDPGLVVLDEASSRLDPATEQLVERAVDRLLAGRTAIVIAHRLTTVQRADAIMILEDGRVREYGAREALAHDPHSRFARLMRAGLQEALV